jgi:predicted transcriptional regulator
MRVNQLRRIREETGRSVTGLSRITGVSRQTIYDLESGHRTGSLETWLKLAAALDTPLEALSGEEYEPLTQYEGKEYAPKVIAR